MNPFQQSFDGILDNILTDFRNLFPDVDTSMGSLAYMKAAGYASNLWGLYKYQEWISLQIFADTASPDFLDHHGWIWGLTRPAGETDSAFLARILARIQTPPAGGNQNDYVQWAEAVDGVARAYCVPMGQGLGTVDVVILADAETTGSEMPSPALLNTVRAVIAAICPTSVKYLRVLAPSVLTEAVTMTLSGADANGAQTAADVGVYLASLAPGQSLYMAQLYRIAVMDGADGATITAPAADVITTPYQMVRAGAINVG